MKKAIVVVLLMMVAAAASAGETKQGVAVPPQGSPVEMGTLAQWAAALATFTAVLVALFREDIVRLWRRPKLDVSIKTAPPDCLKSRMAYQVGTANYFFADCYYFRLLVENRGKARAEKVQVYAAGLSQQTADGAFSPVDSFTPMNLRWAHGGAAPRGVEIYAEGISPQMGKHCDLGHIVDPAHRTRTGEDIAAVPADKSIFAFDVEAPTLVGNHLVSPGTYQLELRVAAANCQPITRMFQINITGVWDNNQQNMFTIGIGIRPVWGHNT